MCSDLYRFIFLLFFAGSLFAQSEETASIKNEKYLTTFSFNNPPGEMVSVGGHFLHVICKGNQDPTVLIDGGLGETSLQWLGIIEILQSKFRVCAYDRAGYAWSQSGPEPRSSKQIVKELNRLSVALKLPPPYILVGHSFGGYTVQLYATTYPEKVGAVLLIESSHPRQQEFFARVAKEHNKKYVRISKRKTVYRDKQTAKRLAQERIFSSARRGFMAQNSEQRYFHESATQVLESYPLPHIPMIVISRGRQEWMPDDFGNSLERTWQELQKDLTVLVPQAEQRIAHDSGHMVHLDQPILVAQAILALRERMQNKVKK